MIQKEPFYRRSVLLVEDEPFLRELIASALTGRGFDVTTAATATQARRAFDAASPDGIVMDVDLGPGPDGFALAEALLDGEIGVAVVFLTNLPDPRFAGRRDSDIPPGVAYLHKKSLSNIDTLADTLDAALRGLVEASMRHDRDPNRPFAGLTAGQVEVLRMVALGESNSKIAEVRGTTVKAVEGTLARAFGAIGIDPAVEPNSRVAAVRRYLRWAGEPLTLGRYVTGR